MYKTDKAALRDFHAGVNYESYKYFGAHKQAECITFRVWAPHAQNVYLVGDFNSWSESDPMKKISDGGVYEISIPAELFPAYSLYKYKIVNKEKVLYKADPYGTFMQTPPDTASVYMPESNFTWTDRTYLNERSKTIAEGIYNKPMNVYEVNLSSLMKSRGGGYISYIEAAEFLSSYARVMGYTHIELMPVAEHPSDESWGYQICGYYAPTSRFGSPDDFRYFVDTLHAAGIGVILDWVPAHFPKDEHGLCEFDGEPLYEYGDKTRQENRTWGTRYFDIAKGEVTSFLISNAVYFAREFHIDGLRADAVSSMLYLDYDRGEGEWTPNRYGGNINLESVAFLRNLNKAMKVLCPDVLMIAEESSAFKNVTTFEDGGLGFDMKWNMGWMNDSLSYISTKHESRSEAHGRLTFPLMYAFSENYILPVSHDEVVYGKKALLDKMPGEYEQKFAGMRAYLTYMMTQSGKKLTFMSCEFGQFAEWDYKKSVEWFMLGYDMHRKLHCFSRDLNNFYLTRKELWECDSNWDGYEWVLCDEAEISTIAYNRIDKDKNTLLIVINFSNVDLDSFTLEADRGEYSVIFSTDEQQYGGTGRITDNSQISANHTPDKTKLTFDLPSNTAVIMKKKI